MKEKILVVAAHPDDEILGCGGTISKKIKYEKAIVNTLILSNQVIYAQTCYYRQFGSYPS